MADTYVILHNIRSAHNVGSIFRTADGAGVVKIFLTGYTPSPVDRFGREHPEIKKTSLGAAEIVTYEVVPDIQELILRLKHEGIFIVAVEQTNNALDYAKFEREELTAYIFGNEVTGIEKEVLQEVGQHLMIPMHGTKESLNVSVCAGIILFNIQKNN